jgi:hypothetical protein
MRLLQLQLAGLGSAQGDPGTAGKRQLGVDSLGNGHRLETTTTLC